MNTICNEEVKKYLSVKIFKQEDFWQLRLLELGRNEGEVVESFSPRDGCDRADSCGVKLPKG